MNGPSEYLFGSGNGFVRPDLARRIDKIARLYGATFVSAKTPEGYRYWFAGPNRGNPFDETMRDEVCAHLVRAGLRDATGLLL